MKRRFWALGVVVAALVVWTAAPSYAFHDSASLICSGCHTMHDSEGGANVGEAGRQIKLLKFSNITDLCLDCHDGDDATYTATPDVYAVGVEAELSGGDFASVEISGDGYGHNLPSTTMSTADDGTLGLTPPGAPGALGASMTCTSCHDAHGTAANCFPFRNLLKTVNGNDVSATITSVNADEATLLTGNNNRAVDNTNHNVYKGDFGTWCAGCHSNALAQDNNGFHGSDVTDTNVGDLTYWLRHGTNTALGAPLVASYGGTYEAAYPLEQVGGTWTTATVGVTAATDKVFCLSCHKAHASQYTNATVWDNTTASGVGTGCNKCHAK